VVGDEEVLQLRKGFARCERRDGVNFHAVAGGENGGLGDEAGVAQGAEGIGDFILGKSEAFAQFDGRGAVAQTDDDDAHLPVTSDK